MAKLSKIEFVKMSGAGNTFMFVDAREEIEIDNIIFKNESTRSDLAKRLCSAVDGLACDGLIFIENGSVHFDFKWDFYNSDGSSAEMCGNAARCAARYCREELIFDSNEIRFSTGAGIVVAKIGNDKKVEIKMPEFKVVNENLELGSKNKTINSFTLVNSGVPHLVKKIENISEVNSLLSLTAEYRSHRDLEKGGANVTYYSVSKNQRGDIASDEIDAITYERGVENFTLSCGTGAVAAAGVLLMGKNEGQVRVNMPGGKLQVNFIANDPKPLLFGEAIFIAKSCFYREE